MKTIIFILIMMTKLQSIAKIELKVESRQVEYPDYSVGQMRTSTDFKIIFNQKELTLKKLKDLVNKSYPGLLSYPTVFDAVEINKNDILIVVSGDSQGRTYPVLRLSVFKKALQVERLKVGGDGSAINWFPHSRISGWTRILGANENQFLVRWSPFKIFDLGQGDLAHTDFPFAFLVESRKSPLARVYNLELEQEVTRLELDGACFQFPRFDFNHPKLEYLSKADDDDHIGYSFGPSWWNRTFNFNKSGPVLLSLKESHPLVAPPRKRFAVLDSSRDHENVIDYLPAKGTDCRSVNPKGYIKSETLRPSEESILASDLCAMEFDGIDSELAKKVCGSPVVKTVFSKNGTELFEKTYSYKPLDSSFSSSLINVYEMKTKTTSFRFVKNPQDYESDEIKKFKILNDSQILLQARSSGPWKVYVLTANAEQPEFDLQYIGWFAFPSTPFESLADNKYLYSQEGRVLIQKKPFHAWVDILGVIAIFDSVIITYWQPSAFDRTNQVYFYAHKITEGTDPYRWREAKIFSGVANKDCLLKIGLPHQDADLATKDKWARTNLIWIDDKNELKVKSCELRPAHDK